MRRRSFIGASIAISFLAGCTGDGLDGGGDDSGSHSADTGTGDYLDEDGTTVPLVSVAEAFEWYDANDVVFVDARPRQDFDDIRIAGAVHSVYPDGIGEDDPTTELSSDTRMVTYCVCPHAMAGMRAASLIENGYSEVYALDEGLQEWYEQGHPVEGDADGVPDPDYHEPLQS